MQFQVTDITFDFEDSEGTLPAKDQQEVINNSIGMWEADDEDDLIEEISTAAGWCIKNISYHHLLTN